MRMIKGVLIAFAAFSLVFLASFAAAANVCLSEDYVVVKLTANTNAHAAVWNYSDDVGYSTQICSRTPVNRSCSNPLIYLNAESNAHASNGSRVGYTVPVCLGLGYTIRNNTCASGETAIMSLSGQTNAHVSNGSEYTVKLCGGAGSIFNAAWQDLNGNQVSKVELDDTVQLVVLGLAPIGEKASWIVYKGNTEFSKGEKDLLGLMNEVITTWQANESGVFKFVATVGGKTYTSGNLNVSASPDNTAPNITIVTPACGSEFNISDVVNVTVTANDPDDNFTGNMSFGDGTSGMVFSGKTVSVSHTYTIGGSFSIVATATDDRGRQSSAVSNIIVINPAVNGVYVAGCIDLPKDYSNLLNATVRFIATSTKAIEFTAPSTRILIPDSSNRLNYTWTFSDMNTQTGTYIRLSVLGNETTLPGDIEPATPFNFTHTFSNPGRNWANLSVEVI